MVSKERRKAKNASNQQQAQIGGKDSIRSSPAVAAQKIGLIIVGALIFVMALLSVFYIFSTDPATMKIQKLHAKIDKSLQENNAQKINQADLTVTDKVYFDLSVEGKPAGRVVLGLYGKVAPKTVANFVHYATQPESKGYKKSPIHRIVPDFIIQGGDFLKGDGTGQTSIYDEKPFADENLGALDHFYGALSMANAGPNTNGMQFFILTRGDQLDHLNNKHQVFGRVLEGMQYIKAINSVPVDEKTNKPSVPVVIEDSGKL